MEEHIINLTSRREIPRTKREAGIGESELPLVLKQINGYDYGKYYSPVYDSKMIFPINEWENREN